MKKILSLSLALGVLCASALSSVAQIASPTLIVATNVPSVVAASVATNGWTSQIIPLTKNCCAALAAQLYVTNGTSVIGIGGSFAVDGTNFGVAPFILIGTAPSNNLAAVTGGTNIPAVMLSTNWTQAQLSGYSALMLNAFTNSSSTSSVFSAGVKLSRPTLNTSTY